MVGPNEYDDAVNYFSDLRFYDKDEFEFVDENIRELEGTLKYLDEHSVVTPSTSSLYAVLNVNNNANFEKFHSINRFLETYIEPFTGLHVRGSNADAELDLSVYGDLQGYMYVSETVSDIDIEQSSKEDRQIEKAAKQVNHRLNDFGGQSV